MSLGLCAKRGDDLYRYRVACVETSLNGNLDRNLVTDRRNHDGQPRFWKHNSMGISLLKGSAARAEGDGVKLGRVGTRKSRALNSLRPGQVDLLWPRPKGNAGKASGVDVSKRSGSVKAGDVHALALMRRDRLPAGRHIVFHKQLPPTDSRGREQRKTSASSADPRYRKNPKSSMAISAENVTSMLQSPRLRSAGRFPRHSRKGSLGQKVKAQLR